MYVCNLRTLVPLRAEAEIDERYRECNVGREEFVAWLPAARQFLIRSRTDRLRERIARHASDCMIHSRACT